MNYAALRAGSESYENQTTGRHVTYTSRFAPTQVVRRQRHRNDFVYSAAPGNPDRPITANMIDMCEATPRSTR
jgi:hypothetical protein